MLVRNEQPLKKLKAEVEEQSKKILSQLVSTGKFDQVTKLAETIKNKKYLEARQIMLDLEKEIQPEKVESIKTNSNN